jgi:methylglutaconyl-CoA hydratase
MADSLRTEITGSVARVTLTRPDVHNAFDDALVGLLHRTAENLAASPEVRVVVLAGEGASFCAGADLGWMQRMVEYGEKENLRDAEAMARMFEAWNDLPKPVVGRIQGGALGGGAGLVAVCDVAVASRNALFGFTEIRLGILPAVISPFVISRIGEGAARALFLTGERFDAERALGIGLVHRVCDADTLDEEVETLVRLLLQGGPQAQARIKTLLPALRGKPPQDARPLTAQAIARARVGAEGQDGIRAFLERRRPAFRGES